MYRLPSMTWWRPSSASWTEENRVHTQQWIGSSPCDYPDTPATGNAAILSLSSHPKDINRKRCTIGRLAVVTTIAHREFLLQASEAKGENGQRSTRLHAKWGHSMQAHRELSHPSFQLDNKKGAVYLVRRNTKWETPCCVNHEEKVSS